MSERSELPGLRRGEPQSRELATLAQGRHDGTSGILERIVELDLEERRRLAALTSFEREYRARGHVMIAGVDEAGRGPLAGPVVAAACVIPHDVLIAGVDDSKKLTAPQRRAIFDRIQDDPRILYGVGISTVEEIDTLNIYQATIVAMWRAIEALPVSVDLLLVDGMALTHASIPCVKIVQGDRLSQSIALASIIAKETRDEMMLAWHDQWPHYGFNKHKGYGTETHREALLAHGPCPIHRRSFEPVKSLFF